MSRIRSQVTQDISQKTKADKMNVSTVLAHAGALSYNAPWTDIALAGAAVAVASLIFAVLTERVRSNWLGLIVDL